MSKKQDSSAIYNILAFRFDGEKGAHDAMKEIKKSGALDGYKIAAECIVNQNAKGKVHMHETGRGGVGTAVGAGSGALLGLIGGPAGLLAWTLAGGVIGGTAGHYWGAPFPRATSRKSARRCHPTRQRCWCCWKTRTVRKSSRAWQATAPT